MGGMNRVVQVVRVSGVLPGDKGLGGCNIFRRSVKQTKTRCAAGCKCINMAARLLLKRLFRIQSRSKHDLYGNGLESVERVGSGRKEHSWDLGMPM
jgi:hypothetical protein